MDRNAKPLTNEQKFKIGAGIGIAVFAVVLHKKKINTLVKLSRAAVEDTMVNSFNEGVKHGLLLAKETALFAKDSMTSMEEMYALGKPLAQGTLSNG